MSRTRRDSESTLVDINDDSDSSRPLLTRPPPRPILIPRSRAIIAGRPLTRQARMVIPTRFRPFPQYEHSEDDDDDDNIPMLYPFRRQSLSGPSLCQQNFWLLIAIFLHIHLFGSLIVLVLRSKYTPGDNWILALALLSGACDLFLLWALFIGRFTCDE